MKTSSHLRLLALAWSLTQTAPSLANLPADVEAALARAKVPTDAVAALVVPLDAPGTPRLTHRAQVPMNPASVMKLVTTLAGLELLGPAYTWTTAVHLHGPIREGSLEGSLLIKGGGDPKLVQERLWLLLRRVQQAGVQRIRGDILLDRSAFDLPPPDPAQFDGEPLRPYNAAPDALLINFKSLVFTFTPDTRAGLARVQMDPPMAGISRPTSVPLQTGDCSDYRSALKADWSDPQRLRFLGAYPSSCGERAWPVAYADPTSYAARAVEGLWRDMGGLLDDSVREARPEERPTPGTTPSLSLSSPPLAEVIRDINKYSNNVMAQHLALSLALPDVGAGPVTPTLARERINQWWTQRWPDMPAPVVDNGSGLSRQERITAQALSALLLRAWHSPLMPDFVASLPLSGVDGTLRRSRWPASAGLAGAHLKTGSLRDVNALAGYVHTTQGRRYALVAIVNHPNASAARPALDALVGWTARQDR